MTTFTVISNADSGAGTLRSDLGIAKDGDIINFAPDADLITLATPLEIKTNVTIEGSQPTATGTPGVIVTGNSVTREFTIDSGVSTKIDGVELSYGHDMGSTPDPTTLMGGTTAAGAIYDRGTLTLSNSLLDHNIGQGFTGSTGFLYQGGQAGGTGVGGIDVAYGATLNLVGNTNAFAANTGIGGSGGQGSLGQYNDTTMTSYAGGMGGRGASATSGMAKTPASAGYDGDGLGGGAGGAPDQTGQNGTGYGGSGGGGGSSSAFADYAGPGTINIVPVCFASGTLIQTAKGNVAVEHLAIGDLVVTASGHARPIRWLGHRTIDCRRNSRRTDVLPIRIAAHAFGSGRPARDLFVSPGHAICVDACGDVLIPAASLVNGTTIVQVEADEVTYWHVELDSHDIILAENLPAESYLEMGNRSFFAERGVVALAASPDAPVRTHADFCRPFHENGAVVEAVRATLGRIAIGNARADQSRVA